MSADFWAGYVSGAVGILVGNPLDLIKTRLQAGGQRESIVSHATSDANVTPGAALAQTTSSRFQRWTSLARGAAAPILGYGALNALLFVTYNRSLALLSSTGSGSGSGSGPGSLDVPPERPSAWSLWMAGALGGLATFFVSAPTELIKCRAQVSSPPMSSVEVARTLWKRGKVRGLYLGGGVTSVRDAVGYGFYFWSYEMSRRAVARDDASGHEEAIKVLLCGGLAGVVTWASIFPLDVIKTRVQTWDLVHNSSTARILEQQTLLDGPREPVRNPGAVRIAMNAYRNEGAGVFFRGLGICSARAFIVNAVQWAVYEWMMKALIP